MKIIQILDAKGWWAEFKLLDGYYYLPVLHWALLDTGKTVGIVSYMGQNASAEEFQSFEKHLRSEQCSINQTKQKNPNL